MAAVHAAQHGAHHGLLQPAAAVGDGLVGERQRIAHRPARRTRQQAQRAFVGRTLLGRQHLVQVLAHVSGAIGRRLNCRQRLSTVGSTFSGSVVASTNFRYSGGSSSVLSMALKASLVSMVRLVDHEDLEAADAGLVGRRSIRADLVDAAVAGGVQLDVVDVAVGVDLGAGLAHAAGLGVMPPVPSGPVQFSDLARMRDTVVLPMPRVPVNR
jgi:hypothetical protein